MKKKTGNQHKQVNSPPLADICFNQWYLLWSMTVLITVGGITSRRFIPIALLIELPVIAVQVWWLIQVARRPWILLVLSLAIFTGSSLLLYQNINYYQTEAQSSKEPTLFSKMHHLSLYPDQLVRFFNDNQISGN
jgi:hypothetical protein